MTECERLLQNGFIDESFLREETRDDYCVSTTIKKVWAIELDLYKKFSEVCDKYSLKYWVAFGTLLGAIRHNGFIPWDDDFDVWMPRDDYEKLLSLSENEFNFPYFMQTTLNDQDYYSAFARLRNSNTTGILNVSQNNKCNNGIFIDIFPLDGAPNHERKRKCRLFLNHLRNVFAHAYVYNVNPSPLARMANKVMHNPLIRYDYKKTYKKVNNYACKYRFGETDYVGMMAFPWKFNANLVFRSDFFAETILHPFEFLKVPVPKGYDKILRERYGDYMQFPPVENRGNWHEFDFAPDIPYTDYKRSV